MRSVVQLVKSCPPAAGDAADRAALLCAAFRVGEGTPETEALLADIRRTAQDMGRDAKLD
jgi:hypothetical protein